MSNAEGLALERRIHIVQGEQYVDSDPASVLTTILGSCVAACLWDNCAGLGGMNHFLLPGKKNIASFASLEAARYGVHSMELLVNELLSRGAERRRLQAKLFGGARMIRGLTDVGELNASFAEQFLRDEGIALVGGSLRGEQGRRIQFWPVTGRARQVLLRDERHEVFLAERKVAVLPPPTSGELELF